MPGPQPRHYHPCILCIVGRGLDPSAGRRGRRPLQHNPQGFSLPQTSAAAWGQAALHPTLPHSVGRAFVRDPFTAVCRGQACPASNLAITTPFILCIVGRGLDPSVGRRGRRPLQHNPQGFSLPQTSAAAWGQAALHPTLPHSVGRAFARNSFTPPCRGRACPALHLAITTSFILCIVGRQATGPLHNRPAPSSTKITCPRPFAGRLLFCFKFFSVPFLLRKGTDPRLVKITSGQSPQLRRPAPAGPAGSARPSGR